MKRTLIVLTALALLAGCQSNPGAVTGGTTKLGGIDSAGYLDDVSRQTTVSEAHAVRGMLLLLSESRDMTFDEGVALLKDRRIVDAFWDFDAERPMTKGKLAYMVYQACHVSGGVMLALTGPSQRYCLREMQYQGLMSEGFFYTPVTGMEMVAVLARADELRTTGSVSKLLTHEEPTQ